MKNIFKINAIRFFILLTLTTQISIKANSHLLSNNPYSVTQVNKDLFIDGQNSVISNAKQMTFEGPRAGEGYFSADGNYMVFQSERDSKNPFFQMYVLNLKTGKMNRVSTGRGNTTCGWIHPSNQKVMFSSTHLDKNAKAKEEQEFANRKKSIKAKYSWSYDETFDIFQTDLNGKNIKRLTNELGYDAEGSYSPDGKWIAFASNRLAYSEKMSPEEEEIFKKDPSYMMDIYIMKSDGSDVKRLTTAKGYDGGPFFSPDGKRITWRRFSASGQTAEIFTMNIDGSDQKQITNLASMSWAPYYHPTGDYIVFASSLLGYSNFELYIVDVNGTHKPVRVSFNEGFDGLAAFSPDGNQITWTHKNEKGESQIYTADWDDYQARELLGLNHTKFLANQMRFEITEADLKKVIAYLSDKSLQGRPTGSPQEIEYTNVIADYFKAIGLKGAGDKGSFIQEFEFTSGVSLGSNNTLTLKIENKKKDLKVGEDFIPYSFSKTGEQGPTEMVFVGYGITAPATDKIKAYDSYEGVDVSGKWVVVFNDIPQNVEPEMRQHLFMYSRPQHKVTVARNRGAIGIVFINGPLSIGEDSIEKLKYEGTLSETSISVLKLSKQVAKDLFSSADKNIKNVQSELDSGKITQAINIPKSTLASSIDIKFEKSKGRNIVGMLPVSGANTSIILGAHGDHLGHGHQGSSLAHKEEKNLAHVGADDNASGVAVITELAHYYATNKSKLNKNLYFAVWSGEELGILGSNYFVKKVKNQKFFANLNFDMVGRYRDNLLLQGVGSAKEWPQLIEKFSMETPLSLSVQNDPYLPTDSVAFYLADIPTLNFFTGAHEEYHTPRDVYGLINFKGLYDITLFAKNITSNLAQNKSNLTYSKVSDVRKNMEGRTFRLYLGTIPDYMQEGVKGVRISGVAKNSPAEKAGLLGKDVVVKFNKLKIENIYDYVYTLQSAKPNEETDIEVLREGKAVQLKIVPELKKE